ncbi:MAG TPA: aminotransferase class III-fold pyridoxal phosphate-dependent enzyme [Solirubrobacteraceae bacterium]|jgi:adenosylmethionine-8-amino-7-oxononanoate aminotransferase
MPTRSSAPGSALWNPQAQMAAVIDDRLTIVRGDGAKVQTADGRWLLDATAGLWHANIGHGRERLAEAASRQMRTLETYHTFGRLANAPALALADRLAAMSPIPDPKVFWGSGGSDAVDTAAKLARRFWQIEGQANKRIIISREWAYHGLHGFGTSLAGIPFNRVGYGSESLIPETARVPTNDADALEAAIRRLGPDRVAAVFAEPVIGTGGVIFPAPGYLQRIEAICREYDVLLVLDEVITGFGRTGRMFATELFEVVPDMILMAKGITSGYAPLGGVLIARRLWEPFYAPDGPIFRHGVTYAGHATACAVAEANLDVLAEEELVARVAELAPELERVLAPLADHPLVTEVRTGVGLLAGVQLAEGVPADTFLRGCVDRGVLLRVITMNTVQISPPFVVTTAELQQIADAIAQTLDTLA